ncbi:Cytokinin dehydrogenase [Stylosanthes scabra]|uniref:cytokinin dehydrogenase n=1 Tax=Stylosanthes scabra TaxID=79078 RepID=A0ABU6VPA8_9FABA|nr:Cytokinin dehydrogenase [Stylosanthes scabra]
MARFSIFQKPLVLLSWLIVVVANTIVLSHALTQPCSSSSLQAHGIKVISPELVCDNATLTLASTDYGHTSHEKPLAVLEPTSLTQISKLIKLSNSLSTPFTIAARAQAHSIHGQAMAREGIVVNMTNLNRYRHGRGIVIVRNEKDAWSSYADVGGEQTWVDLLHAALEYGLTPVTWTDSLDLSIGGTLSNAGTGGEAFRFGPQITNVYELDVITGKGDYVTCSAKKNSKLFYAVLGGLGQFGIITRARIALAPSKPRAKWLRMIYTEFPAFIKDKKHLSSFNGRRDDKAPDYVEGAFLIKGWQNNIAFYPTQDLPRVNSLINNHTIVYVLELVKYYNNSTQAQIDQEIENLIKGFKFVPTFKFEKDVAYEEFINRNKDFSTILKTSGLSEAPNAWLNIFIPASRIFDINEAVFKGIVVKQNITSFGVSLIIPMNRTKWNDKMSAAIPDEEFFYLVTLLHIVTPDKLASTNAQNNQIMEFCKKSGIGIKEYLPYNKTLEEWKEHFGPKWPILEARKDEFDPKRILSPGQKIFNN